MSNVGWCRSSCGPRPDQTPGTLGPQWRHEVGEFYTYDGALALRDGAVTGARAGKVLRRPDAAEFDIATSG